MWVFTKHGFFSAVCARQGSGERGQPVDPNRIMVRARVRGHLEALRKRFPALLGKCAKRKEDAARFFFQRREKNLELQQRTLPLTEGETVASN
jgi:hypothetical protein